jgi:hypothetical protein
MSEQKRGSGEDPLSGVEVYKDMPLDEEAGRRVIGGQAVGIGKTGTPPGQGGLIPGVGDNPDKTPPYS